MSRFIVAAFALVALLVSAGPGAAQKSQAPREERTSPPTQIMTLDDLRRVNRLSPFAELASTLAEAVPQEYAAIEIEVLKVMNTGRHRDAGVLFGTWMAETFARLISAAPAAEMIAFGEARTAFIEAVARDNPAACAAMTPAHVLGLMGPKDIGSRDSAVNARFHEARRRVVLASVSRPSPRTAEGPHVGEAVDRRMALRGFHVTDLADMGRENSHRTPAERCRIAVAMAHALTEVGADIAARFYIRPKTSAEQVA